MSAPVVTLSCHACLRECVVDAWAICGNGLDLAEVADAQLCYYPSTKACYDTTPFSAVIAYLESTKSTK